MSYRVIKFFTDKQDNGYAYKVGDTFPRDGVEVSEKRIAVLLGNNNRQKTPVIEEIAKTETFMNTPVQVEEPVQEVPFSDEKEEKVEVKKTVKRGRSKKNI